MKLLTTHCKVMKWWSEAYDCGVANGTPCPTDKAERSWTSRLSASMKQYDLRFLSCLRKQDNV
jgi:hypothetical protein